MASTEGYLLPQDVKIHKLDFILYWDTECAFMTAVFVLASISIYTRKSFNKQVCKHSESHLPILIALINYTFLYSYLSYSSNMQFLLVLDQLNLDHLYIFIVERLLSVEWWNCVKLAPDF